MSVTIILSIAMLAALQPAADWEQVAQTPRGTVAADLASRQRAGDVVTLNTRTMFGEALADGTVAVTARMRYDCRRNRSETLAVTMTGADGAVISAQEVPADQRQMEPVVSDSPDAALAAFACR